VVTHQLQNSEKDAKQTENVTEKPVSGPGNREVRQGDL